MKRKLSMSKAGPWKVIGLGFSMALGAAGCAVGVDGGYDGGVGVAYTGDYYDPYCCAYGGGWGGWGHDHYRVGPPGRGGGPFGGPRGSGPHGGGPSHGGGGPRGGGAPSIPSGARGGGARGGGGAHR